MTSFFEFLNRLLLIIQSLIKTKKTNDLQKKYEAIDEDLKDYVTGDASDGNTELFTPNGRPPTIDDLRKNSESK